MTCPPALPCPCLLCHRYKETTVAHGGALLEVNDQYNQMEIISLSHSSSAENERVQDKVPSCLSPLVAATGRFTLDYFPCPVRLCLCVCGLGGLVFVLNYFFQFPGLFHPLTSTLFPCQYYFATKPIV